jgi:hypothetical protein
MNRRNVIGLAAGALSSTVLPASAKTKNALSRNEKLARARVAANSVRAGLSKHALRNRLSSVGVCGEWLDADLVSLGLHGTGIQLQLGGQGQLLTGPGIDLRLRSAFPELAEQMSPTLGTVTPNSRERTFSTLSTHDALPTNVPPTTPVSTPWLQQISTLYFDLSGVSSSWSISSVVHHLWADNTGDPSSSTWGDIYGLLVTDPYGHTNFGNGIVYRNTGRWDSITWPSAGWGWVLSNAGSSSVSPGNLQVDISSPGTLLWIVTVWFAYLRITY